MSTEAFFSTGEELTIFLYSLLLGGFFGGVYDIFRCLRGALPHKKTVVFLEDVLYMLFCALCFFVFSVELVRGQLRFFVLTGSAAGFFVWHYTLGNIAVFVIKGMIRLVKKIIFVPALKLLLFFLKPIKFISKKSIKTVDYFKLKCTMLKKSKKSRKKNLKDKPSVVYNK